MSLKPLAALAVLAVLVAGLAACSRESAPDHKTAPAAQRAPRVLESFQVGGGVYVRSLAVEPAKDSLWVGTSAGVMEIDLNTRNPRHTFTRKDGLANEYVFAIGIDSQGYKWFGTNAGGASRYRDGEWRTFFPMHGLADYWVYAFAEQPGGVLWIGTWAGANSVDLKTLTFKTYLKELVNEWVYGLAVDSKGRVWFGTEGGVSMYDGRAWRSWTHRDGLGAANAEALSVSPNTGLGTRSRHDLSVMEQGRETYNPNYVFALHVAPDDSVWAGTWGGGLAHFDGMRWTNYTAADGLAGNIVYSLAQDRDGALWLGTNHGASRFDGKTWQTYDRKAGLLDDNVYAIAVTAGGDIWAGTKGGVTRIGQEVAGR